MTLTPAWGGTPTCEGRGGPRRRRRDGVTRVSPLPPRCANPGPRAQSTYTTRKMEPNHRGGVGISRQDHRALRTPPVPAPAEVVLQDGQNRWGGRNLPWALIPPPVTGFVPGAAALQHYQHLRLFWGGTAPERPLQEGTRRPQLSPASPGEDGAKRQWRNKALRGHRDEARCRLAPRSHHPAVCLRTDRAAPGRSLLLQRRFGVRGHSCSGFSSRCCSHSASTTL